MPPREFRCVLLDNGWYSIEYRDWSLNVGPGEWTRIALAKGEYRGDKILELAEQGAL